jgi:adenosylhomocysteine nucleosidase
LSLHRPTSFSDAPSIIGSSSNPIVLFAATRWELAAIRRAIAVEQRVQINGVNCFAGRQAGRVYWLVPTGVGPESADTAAGAILSRQRAALAISAGFAGALDPAAAVGDVVVATSVVSGTFDTTWTQGESAIVCEEAVLRVVQTAASDMKVTVRSGPMLSLTTVICRAVEKQDLHRVTGAVAVDMESAAIGKVAQSQGVPFAVVRTVSDVAGEDLPLDFNAFLKPWGWMRGIGAMIISPSSVTGLNRLRRHSRMAAERLTALCAVCAPNGFGLSSVSQAGRA